MSLDLAKFCDRLRGARPKIVGEAVALAGPKIAVVAVAGIRRGLNDGVSPDGTPFEPLRFPRAAGGDKPLLSTGLMAASVSALVSVDELVLRANSPGAAAHQFGARIVPKRARALTIPLTREAARVGSPRRFPRPLFTVKGKDCLFERQGKKGKIVAVYLFRAAVVVPARPFLGVSAATAVLIADAVADRYVYLVTKIFGG